MNCSKGDIWIYREEYLEYDDYIDRSLESLYEMISKEQDKLKKNIIMSEYNWLKGLSKDKRNNVSIKTKESFCLVLAVMGEEIQISKIHEEGNNPLRDKFIVYGITINGKKYELNFNQIKTISASKLIKNVKKLDRRNIQFIENKLRRTLFKI